MQFMGCRKTGHTSCPSVQTVSKASASYHQFPHFSLGTEFESKTGEVKVKCVMTMLT